MGLKFLSILIFSAFCATETKYVLEIVELPSDDKDVKYFSDDVIALHDGSDVS